MSTFAFQSGVVVHIDGNPNKLLRQVEKGLWQIEDQRTRRLAEFTEQELRAFYCAGRLRYRSLWEQAESVDAGPVRADFTPQQWESARVRRAYVQAIEGLPANRRYVAPVIRETWERLRAPARPPHVASVLRWRSKYRKAGEAIEALMERSDRKGNRTERFSKELQEIVEIAIDAKYMVLERGTIQDALDEAIALTNRENQLRPAAFTLPRPTRRLIKRLIDQIPAFERCVARYGRQEAIKRFRSRKGHVITAAPLERAEIDHTVLNLMVIDDRSGLPLGRPWITVCLDDYSRCVLGLYISFEPPSYFTVARCLKHAVLPKVSLQKDYPWIATPWEAHGVMRTLVVDNGLEFHSDSLENACAKLNIIILYTPRKTPWLKGKIERLVGSLNRGVAHGTPGTTFQDIFEKGDYDPKKHAVLTLRALHELVNKWIVDVYHRRPHRALQTTPSVMWASSIDSSNIRLPDDPTKLDAILGRSETRKLTHVGIEVDYLFYNSPALTDRKLGENLDVEVRIDDANLGKIVVFAPDTGELIEAHSINSQYAEGLSRWQHKVCRRFAHQNADRHSRSSPDSPEAYLEAKLQIAERIREGFLTGQLSGKRVARYLSSEQTSEIAATAVSKCGSSSAAERPQSFSSDPSPPVATQRSRAPVDSQIEHPAPVRPKAFSAMRRNRTAQASPDMQRETES